MENLLKMSRTGLNSPWTSSCGRLFDGVSALLGIKPVIAYEAQIGIIESSLEFGDIGYDFNA